MSLNLRIDNGVAVLSNIARLMNDPRYSTSSRDLEHDPVAQGPVGRRGRGSGPVQPDRASVP